MQARHILPLTGIRFFAALWVVVYHFPYKALVCPYIRILDPLINLGYEAVPLFFLLSGFILSHNYFSNWSLVQHPKFIFLRFARLWPVHIFVIALMINPNIVHLNEGQLKSLLEEIFMVRFWFHSDIDLTGNAPAWSISAEWFAYICVFPLAFLLFKRLKHIPCLVIIVLFCLIAQVSFINTTLLPPFNKCGTIFFLFLAGSGLYRIRSLVKDPPAEEIVMCGIFFLLSYVFFNQVLSTFVLYVAFALLIFGLSYERGFLARILSNKIIVQGGLASYSLYMIHWLVIQRFVFYTWDYWKIVSHSMLAQFIVLIVFVSAFAGVTAVSYRYVEVPANRKLRNLLKYFEAIVHPKMNIGKEPFKCGM